MTYRERLADLICGGALTRARRDAAVKRMVRIAKGALE